MYEVVRIEELRDGEKPMAEPAEFDAVAIYRDWENNPIADVMAKHGVTLSTVEQCVRLGSEQRWEGVQAAREIAGRCIECGEKREHCVCDVEVVAG